MSELTDKQRLDRGDIWSNKRGWMSREEASMDSARIMLPLHRIIWDNYFPDNKLTDDQLVDFVVTSGLTPIDLAFEKIKPSPDVKDS